MSDFAVSLLDDIKSLADRIETLERSSDGSVQLADGVTIIPAVPVNYSSIQVYRQTTAPTGLNASIHVGSIWYDTDAGNAASWWDGFAWRTKTASSPLFAGSKELSALGPAVLNQSLSDIYIYSQSTAPTSPAFGWMWRDTSAGNAIKRWNGSTWSTITDTFIIAATNAALDYVGADVSDNRIRVYFSSSFPGGQNTTTDKGNLLFKVNSNYDKYIWDGSAWISLGSTIGVESNTDGIAPSYSPIPQATDGIGSVYLKWNYITNTDPVTYAVHVSTIDNFTPTTATQVIITSANTALVRVDGTGNPLEYNQIYYFKIIARDGDGAAIASAQAVGTPQQATNVDISADYIYAGAILANQISTG